VKQDQNFF